MKFKLDSPQSVNTVPLDYSGKVVLLGSCFSDEIAGKLKNAGFAHLSNPFGTIFHPLALANGIKQALSAEPVFDYLQDKNYAYCWDASHLLYAPSREEMQKRMEAEAATLKNTLSEASHLFITLGTSWAYEEISLQKTVANCHKQNANRFVKKLSTVDEMKANWLEVLIKLKEINPQLYVCFTVSPVRHIKDGLVENNRSKARLFELLNQLEIETNVGYFPSYEIVLDELRDYRFYASDLIHPSVAAIDYVWEKWLEAYCSEETKNTVKQVENLRLLAAHQLMKPESVEANRFLEEMERKIQDFLLANPAVVW